MTKGSRLGTLARAVLRTQTDERLVALAHEGRDAAFEEIVRRYRPGLVAFAAAFAPSDRVEDVVQESLVRAWKALADTSEEIHLKAWLYTIVRNRALNARRDAKPHAQLSEQIDGVPQPPELVMSRAELAAVVGAVNALPEPQREALVRSAVEGHTHDQIATALGSSVGAVRQLIYRARLNLRTGLGLMLPLPLVRMLAEHGTETAAAGGVAGGAALGAAGGASALAKVATLAAIGTIAAGAGVAVHQASDDGAGAKPQAEGRQDGRGEARDFEAATVVGASDRGAEDGSGEAETADDHGGEREAGDDSGTGSGDSGDSGPGPSSGPGGGDDGGSEAGSGADSSDHSGPGGADSGSSGSGPSGGDSSGSSSSDSGSGSDDSTSSGSGSGDLLTEDRSGPGGGDLTDPLTDDHSRPGGGGDLSEVPESPNTD